MQTALEELLKSKHEAETTERINRQIEKYGDPADGEDAWLDAVARGVMRNVEWKE